MSGRTLRLRGTSNQLKTPCYSLFPFFLFPVFSFIAPHKFMPFKPVGLFIIS